MNGSDSTNISFSYCLLTLHQSNWRDILVSPTCPVIQRCKETCCCEHDNRPIEVCGPFRISHGWRLREERKDKAEDQECQREVVQWPSRPAQAESRWKQWLASQSFQSNASDRHDVAEDQSRIRDGHDGVQCYNGPKVDRRQDERDSKANENRVHWNIPARPDVRYPGGTRKALVPCKGPALSGCTRDDCDHAEE